MTTIIENAVIESTMLGYEDHGIFTAFVFVKGSGLGCGFGGYRMDQWDEAKKERIAKNGYGLEFIKRVLAVVGAPTWEKLPGHHCRVETEGLGGGIRRIGNIIDDKWFDPKELAREFGLRD